MARPVQWTTTASNSSALRPGGFLLATLSAGGSDGVQGDFLGVPMYLSGHDADGNRELVAQAGFEAVLDEVVTVAEPDGPATFHRVLAQARANA